MEPKLQNVPPRAADSGSDDVLDLVGVTDEDTEGMKDSTAAIKRVIPDEEEPKATKVLQDKGSHVTTTGKGSETAMELRILYNYLSSLPVHKDFGLRKIATGLKIRHAYHRKTSLVANIFLRIREMKAKNSKPVYSIIRSVCNVEDFNNFLSTVENLIRRGTLSPVPDGCQLQRQMNKTSTTKNQSSTVASPTNSSRSRKRKGVASGANFRSVSRRCGPLTNGSQERGDRRNLDGCPHPGTKDSGTGRDQSIGCKGDGDSADIVNLCPNEEAARGARDASGDVAPKHTASLSLDGAPQHTHNVLGDAPPPSTPLPLNEATHVTSEDGPPPTSASVTLNEFGRLLLVLRDEEIVRKAWVKSQQPLSKNELSAGRRNSDFWVESVEPAFNNALLSFESSSPIEITEDYTSDYSGVFRDGKKLKSSFEKFKRSYNDLWAEYNKSGQNSPSVIHHMKFHGMDFSSLRVQQIALFVHTFHVGTPQEDFQLTSLVVRAADITGMSTWEGGGDKGSSRFSPSARAMRLTAEREKRVSSDTDFQKDVGKSIGVIADCISSKHTADSAKIQIADIEAKERLLRAYERTLDRKGVETPSQYQEELELLWISHREDIRKRLGVAGAETDREKEPEKDTE